MSTNFKKTAIDDLAAWRKLADSIQQKQYKWLMFYDLIAHQFTSHHAYVIQSNQHWNWLKNGVYIHKRAPILLDVVITAPTESIAIVLAEVAVKQWLNKVHR